MNRDQLKKRFLTEEDQAKFDEITQNILSQKGYNLDTILPKSEVLYLKTSANLGLGGASFDVTDEVHPYNKFMAERASKVIGLNVAGIDIIAPNINQPITETGGVFLEINAAPDFRMHIRPTKGVPRNVAKNLLDMLFPKGAKARVPIFSVTGTAGKTTVVNLLHRCLRLAGFHIGMTSTEALYIGTNIILKGDTTYPEHVAIVLKDPTIDCAILETSREGILRKGLGYQFADVGIFLNMFDEHVGQDDIKYLEDLAYAKSVVVEQVYDDGYSVLNADNEFVLDARDRVYGNVVLFSRFYENEEIRKHTQEGGKAVAIDRDSIFILDGSDKIRFLDLKEIPLTFDGKAKVNFDNILATIAALYAFGIDVDIIRKGLSEYYPNTKELPGRMNLIRVKNFDVLIDYAHSKVAFDYLKDFLGNFDEEKIGVLDAAGDRSDEEIKTLGRLAGETYNRIIFYEGIDCRGRKQGEIVNLLKQGALSAGFDESKISLFSKPKEAWEFALSLGGQGKIIVILTPTAEKTLEVIDEFRGRR